MSEVTIQLTLEASDAVAVIAFAESLTNPTSALVASEFSYLADTLGMAGQMCVTEWGYEIAADNAAAGLLGLKEVPGERGKGSCQG